MTTPELELIVTMLNINLLHNRPLMEHCKTLKEYALYVDRVRHYTNEMELLQAVNRAVDECISEGILRDFLTRCKAEVIQMSIFEYDEEFELEKLRKAEREAGFHDGIYKGYQDGIHKGYQDGIHKGELQGEIKIISMVRKKMKRQLDYSAIAEVLELDKLYIKKIVDFIEINPNSTDEEVAATLI